MFNKPIPKIAMNDDEKVRLKISPKFTQLWMKSL